MSRFSFTWQGWRRINVYHGILRSRSKAAYGMLKELFSPVANTKTTHLLISCVWRCLQGTLGAGAFLPCQSPSSRPNPRGPAKYEEWAVVTLKNSTLLIKGSHKQIRFISWSVPGDVIIIHLHKQDVLCIVLLWAGTSSFVCTCWCALLTCHRLPQS